MHLIETGLTVAAVVLLARARVGRVRVLSARTASAAGAAAFAPPPAAAAGAASGSQQTRRLGAKHVHRVKLSLRQAWEERGQP